MRHENVTFNIKYVLQHSKRFANAKKKKKIIFCFATKKNRRKSLKTLTKIKPLLIFIFDTNNILIYLGNYN